MGDLVAQRNPSRLRGDSFGRGVANDRLGETCVAEMRAGLEAVELGRVEIEASEYAEL